jgi:tripartite-type tricarboxylate transporter receptor subunit TctC
LANPEVRNRMVTQGADPAFMGSDEFGQFLAAETPRWAAAVKASGAKLD